MNHFEKDLKEIATPDLFLPMLRAKQEELLGIIDSKRKALNCAPQGRLRIAVNRGKPQWFHVGSGSSQDSAIESQQGTYIPQSDEKLARRLAQKSYDEKVLAAARTSLNVIEKFLDSYEKNSVNDVAVKMHEARQALIRPVICPDEKFTRMWESVPYEGKGLDDCVGVFTARGERVRSKSEVIIANTLHSLNIPYRYEFPHKMALMKTNGGKNTRSAVFYPDFTCLNLRTRQEFVWEHFGLVEDEDYARNMVSKIEHFAKNGFYPGVNLITTSETREIPLDSALVRLYAEKYLL